MIIGLVTQLRKAAYAIKNSTTIILPEWFAVLARISEVRKKKGEPPLTARMMPRDVATRWNSTYEMLSFAFTYREAYNEITSNRDMKMRKYELSDREWKVVNDLASVLKVSTADFF